MAKETSLDALGDPSEDDLVDIGAKEAIDGRGVFHVGRINPPDAVQFVELWNGRRREIRHLKGGITAEDVVSHIGQVEFVKLGGPHPSAQDRSSRSGRVDWYRRSWVRSLHPYPPGEEGAPILPGQTGTIVKYLFSPPYKGFDARRVQMEGGAIIDVDVDELKQLFGME